MTASVALLRGIGPATHASMPLARLAEAMSAAGLDDVRNVGSTGNLVFSSGRPQAAVEALVTEAVKGFGLNNEVFTRTARQVQMLVGLAPFPAAAADRPDRLGICFFHKDPRWPREYLAYAGPEHLRMFSNHLIVDYGPRTIVTRLLVEKAVGARMTQRSWTSVLRIAAALVSI
jgi:uncharacterized protein (DUF1697 family)